MQRFYDYELYIIDTLQYNFDCDHIYNFLMISMNKIFGIDYANKSISWQNEHIKKADCKFARYVLYLVNDSYRSTLCLQCSAQQIVIGIIYLALKLCNITIQLSNRSIPWYTKLLFNCSDQLLKDNIVKDILKTCGSTNRKLMYKDIRVEIELYGKLLSLHRSSSSKTLKRKRSSLVHQNDEVKKNENKIESMDHHRQLKNRLIHHHHHHH